MEQGFDVTAQSAERDYKRVLADMRAYLDEMNVPQQIADLMVSIPPERMKILTDSELAGFLLNQMDPAHDELVASRFAKQYGLDLVEYRRRESRVGTVCTNFTPSVYTSCRDDVLSDRR